MHFDFFFFFFFLPGVGDSEVAVLISRCAGGSVALVGPPLRLHPGPDAAVVVLALWETEGENPGGVRVGLHSFCLGYKVY